MPIREETETVITWTLADGRATIYTLMPRIARLCQRAGAEEIRKDHGIRDGRKESWTFLIDPSCIAIRRKRTRKLTDEQREQARNRLRDARSRRNAHASEVAVDGE